ncbi:MAG: MoaD/ThiS family protein [Betaproteobacteria bacterium]|nr:MoaD/ThiS family protein [Betaproteobacteria bacterium]
MIPSALRSYTGDAESEATGATLGEALADLDRRHPGIRFRMVDEQDRIRRHIRIFVNGEQRTGLATPLGRADEIIIVQALSGASHAADAGPFEIDAATASVALPPPCPHGRKPVEHLQAAGERCVLQIRQACR